MDDSPNIVDETTQTALLLDKRRDRWIEQRLNYLAAEQARLEGRRAPPAFLARRRGRLPRDRGKPEAKVRPVF
jgi:hypothetical protein